ncbi:unnamed protein product [Cylindrotheca closterium]|uniref:Methyltransferase domain-containing protein n=1 Tax=Cylindrotheca closterium TaxID=2856 RepID=A0AAD2GBA8_9STRA|nr:unnamed protein product [Cylindrotheca closterium]
MTNTTSSHYEAHSNESYEEAYFYEPGTYMQHLVDLVGTRLKLGDASPPCRLIDIGGGTGNFAQALMDSHPSKFVSTVVDPFLDPTASGKDVKGLDFVKESAEVFMQQNNSEDVQADDSYWRNGYHKVLLKEVAHHFKAADRVKIFKGIYNALESSEAAGDSSDDSALLIVTRPQVEIDYPLWDEARQVWKENQPSATDFMNELKEAGFVNIQQTLEPYPCQIPLDRWQSMVKGKFWSTFSNFSDEELEAACETIAKDYADRVGKDGILHFEDRLVFISAGKKKA